MTYIRKLSKIQPHAYEFNDYERTYSFVVFEFVRAIPAVRRTF